jgi:hypothetical protein
MGKHHNTDDGRTRAVAGRTFCAGTIEMPDEDAVALGVTVLENGVAARKLPNDLLRGDMDVWWEADDTGGQNLTFMGIEGTGSR